MKRGQPIVCGVAMLLALLTPKTASAVARTWTGLLSNQWNVGLNWVLPGVPTLADDVTIGNAAVTVTTTSAQVQTIQVQQGATVTCAGATTLTIKGAGGMDIAAATDNSLKTIACPIVLGSDLSISTNNATGGLTLSGPLSGAFSLSRTSGSATLTLSGASTFSGGFSNTTNGPVVVQNASGLGTGAATFRNDSPLFLPSDADTTFGNAINFTSSGTLLVGAINSGSGNVLAEFSWEWPQFVRVRACSDNLALDATKTNLVGRGA